MLGLNMILLTGGLGYIGSHMAAALLAEQRPVVIVDNLSNSEPAQLARLAQLTGVQIPFVQADIRDTAAIAQVLGDYAVDAVIHFAALKSPSESVQQPLRYYDHNVTGTLSLLQTMQQQQVHRLVFSSSAAVYGIPQHLPIDEAAATVPLTPYGHSKLIGEQVIRDAVAANPALQVALLRYFNPVGAHPSALIGESPKGVPANLMPYLAQVATGQRAFLQVFGDDYDTVDGTGVRDYIHVMDLVEGHLKALEWLMAQGQNCCETFNLGCGHGVSVLQMIRAFELAVGRSLPYQVFPRRAGDAASVYADAGHAARLLGWQTRLTVEDMARDLWAFAQKNQV